MGNFVIVIGTIILFFQWMHPLQYLRLNMLISKKEYTAVSMIGAFFVIGMFSWMYYIFKNIEVITNEEQILILAVTAVFFILYVVFNFVFTIYAFIKAKEKGKSFHRLILLIPIAPFFFIIAYLIVLFFYTMFGGSYSYELTNIIKIFDNDEMLVFKLLIRLILLSFVTVMAYIVLQYLESITLKVDLKIDENKVIRNKQIERRLSYHSLGLVFLVGTMISFFHFAEIDTSTFDAQFQVVYERTLDVFQMIASALFIPLFLNILLDGSKLSRSNSSDDLNKGDEK